jgi:hypothetical protein
MRIVKSASYTDNVRCQVSGVGRQSYYHYRHHTENKPVYPEYEEMLEWVQTIAEAVIIPIAVAE